MHVYATIWLGIKRLSVLRSSKNNLDPAQKTPRLEQLRRNSYKREWAFGPHLG